MEFLKNGDVTSSVHFVQLSLLVSFLAESLEDFDGDDLVSVMMGPSPLLSFPL